jgi:hypothetical protein
MIPLLKDITKRNSTMDHEKSTQRPHGIGGSDIAALLGLSPYKTPLELWAEKVGHPGKKWLDVAPQLVAYLRTTTRKSLWWQTTSKAISSCSSWAQLLRLLALR